MIHASNLNTWIYKPLLPRVQLAPWIYGTVLYGGISSLGSSADGYRIGYYCRHCCDLWFDLPAVHACQAVDGSQVVLQAFVSDELDDNDFGPLLQACALEHNEYLKYVELSRKHVEPSRSVVTATGKPLPIRLPTVKAKTRQMTSKKPKSGDLAARQTATLGDSTGIG